MTNINFEIFLGNFSFIILFLIMISYWVQAIFAVIPKFHFIIFLSTASANIALLSLLLIRWVNYGHFPLSNLYESLLFLSWSFTLIQLIFTFAFSPSPLKITNLNTLNYNTIIGLVISPIALFTNSFATFSLPKAMQKAQALVPALQSNWLMMHVTIMMLSYTALLCGSLLAITFLIITWQREKNSNQLDYTNPDMQTELLQLDKNNTVSSQVCETSSNSNIDDINNFETISYSLVEKNSNSGKDFSIKNKKAELSTFAKTLDNLSYRILGIGFPLLTIGILSGAVWANEAWGSYWSWDPKETWAFITWLTFAIYLHTRITKGWEGKKPAILASFGFFIVWICYLGVNILGTGLHSYGWIELKT